MCVWMRVREAAAHANVGQRTFRNWLYERGLKYSRVGGLILISKTDLDFFIADSSIEQCNEKK